MFSQIDDTNQKFEQWFDKEIAKDGIGELTHSS